MSKPKNLKMQVMKLRRRSRKLQRKLKKPIKKLQPSKKRQIWTLIRPMTRLKSRLKMLFQRTKRNRKS